MTMRRGEKSVRWKFNFVWLHRIYPLNHSQLWVEKHRDHIQKLETLLRMMDNDQVEVQQIKDIQEDIDNYIENSQEPDFFENEFIYEDIEGLEEMLLDVI